LKKGLIFDFGYQGKTIFDLVDFVLANNVEVVFDVRWNAERVRKFRRRDVEGALRNVGVKYIWARGLGNPYRNYSKEAWTRFYLIRLRESGQAKALIGLITSYLLEGKNVCLLCYEGDADECHRSVIREIVEEKLRK